mgnify:FL=1
MLYMTRGKKRLIILTLTQFLVLLILLLTNKIFFATNDDTTMVDIASGGYGKCSPYIINIHIILGIIYSFFFKIFPIVNWVTVSYLATYLIAGFLLNLVFCKIETHFCIVYTMLIANFIIVISYFSFTVVAYYAAIAGIISCLYAIKSNNKKYYIYGIITILIGVLFRGEVLKSLCVILGLFIISQIGKKNLKRYIYLLVLLVLGMYISIHSNLFIETSNPIEKQHLTWGETRSNALDCAQVPYDEEKFNKVGISYEQYLGMYNAFYYDYNHISTEQFEKLDALNTYDNKFNFDLIQFGINYINKLRTYNVFSSLYILMFLITMIYFCVDSLKKNNKREILAVLIWLGVVSTDIIFFVIKRAPYRVVMPNYIFGIYLLIFSLDDEFKINIKRNVGKYILNVGLLLLPVITLYWRYEKFDLFPDYLISNEREEVLNYLENENDVIFMAGDTRVFSVDVGRSIWDYTARHGYWNIMGNWEIYGEAYYDLMDIYNIEKKDSLLLESINSDKVKIITTYGDDFPEYFSYILSWIKKYYDIDAVFEKTEDISEVTVYDGYYENWSVYRIKTIDWE